MSRVEICTKKHCKKKGSLRLLRIFEGLAPDGVEVCPHVGLAGQRRRPGSLARLIAHQLPRRRLEQRGIETICAAVQDVPPERLADAIEETHAALRARTAACSAAPGATTRMPK